MITKKLYFKLSLVLGCGLLIASCTKDGDEINSTENSQSTEVAKVNLKATGTYNSNTAKGQSFKTMNANLEISEFMVNIKEIELEFDDDYRIKDDYYGSDDEIELQGPFELNLLDNAITFAVVDIPQARYEELEFEFDEGKNASSELYGKTILIRGTIDSSPFEFWHDFEEDVEIDFEDNKTDIIIDENDNAITINFNLTGILNGIDFNLAQDGNEDGLIEISPRDNDGNRAMANKIKERIKDYIDLLDD